MDVIDLIIGTIILSSLGLVAAGVVFIRSQIHNWPFQSKSGSKSDKA